MLLESQIFRELNHYLSKHRVALSLEGLRKMSEEFLYAAALFKKDEKGQVYSTEGDLNKFLFLYGKSLPESAVERGYGYNITEDDAKRYENQESIFNTAHTMLEKQRKKRHKFELDHSNNMVMDYEFIDRLNNLLKSENYKIDMEGLRALVDNVGNIRGACVAKEEGGVTYFIKSQLEILMEKHQKAIIKTCIEKGYARPIGDEASQNK